MSRYGFTLDMPLEDYTAREGDLDPIQFTLTDKNGAIDVTGKTIELKLRNTRGVIATVTISSADVSPKLVLTTPASGIIHLHPAADTFSAAKGPYEAYFKILPNQTVPQDQFMVIDVIQAF